MLELLIEIAPELAGDLATRIMNLWPGLEVETVGKGVLFHLPLDEQIDYKLSCLEETLQTLERIRALEPLDVNSRNLTGPDSGPGSIRWGRFLIRQPSSAGAIEDDLVVINLEAGHAFGTGSHPSTGLALTALEEYFTDIPGAPSRAGSRVLDVGTGSGVLALAAALSGAGGITAVDTAPEAIESVRENAALNNMSSAINPVQCAADQVTGEFDLILANLTPSVLLRNGKKLVPLLVSGGTMILSGFADSQTPQVVRSVTKPGLQVQKSYSHDGWAALNLVKPGLWMGIKSS